MSKTGFCTIHILFFGPAKELVGMNEMQIEVATNTSLAQLREELMVMYPKLNGLKSLAFAVNEVFEGADYLINAGDTVALIPPVSGG